jgi:hypothetical protein
MPFGSGTFGQVLVTALEYALAGLGRHDDNSDSEYGLTARDVQVLQPQTPNQTPNFKLNTNRY